MALCTQWEGGRDAHVWTRWSATTPTPTPGSLQSLWRWPSQVQQWWLWTACSMLLVENAGFYTCRVFFFFLLFILILCGVFIHSGCVTAGGAVLEDGDGTDLAQVYNPKTAVWTEVAPMQIARSGSAACTLKGKIYVIGNKLIIQPINCALFWFLKLQSCLLNPFFVGGWHASTENTDKVECYNPKTNQWTMCAPMKERRYRPGAAVVDGKIYVLGGEEGWDRWGAF